jgi:hypothetical protein
MVALLYLNHAYNESDGRFTASLALQPDAIQGPLWYGAISNLGLAFRGVSPSHLTFDGI